MTTYKLVCTCTWIAESGSHSVRASAHMDENKTHKLERIGFS